MKVAALPAYRNKDANPYNWLLYTALRKKGVSVLEAHELLTRPQVIDILHLHWPEHFLSRGLVGFSKGLGLLIFLTLLAKFSGAKIIWTVHNLLPHERRLRLLYGIFYTLLAKVVDGLIFLSRVSQEQFFLEPHTKGFHNKTSTIIQHGHYREAYPTPPPKKNARQSLGLSMENFVLLFLGQVRPYKGLDELILSFRSLQEEDLSLLVVGKPLSPAFAREIRQMAQMDPRIRFVLRYVQPDEIPLFLGVADALVLPYKVILNSGAALLGLSFGLPVIAPSLGSMPEIAGCVGEWLTLYQPPLTEGKLAEAMSKVRNQTYRQEILETYLETISWDRIADQTKDFYERLVGVKKR